ncbi:hypothetical protein BJ508DRAFT_378925 [Ascobolus immersus RN42]|uniref:Uncharacterized protein n=1 Tax=Ascobolus immersus RN42 TaxID=1160509 RepID=A0A3N4HWC7_ASCIM|nr:hypothetical protein BJ508DRAFT_378925 [Ascobolus immersus RN42]
MLYMLGIPLINVFFRVYNFFVNLYPRCVEYIFKPLWGVILLVFQVLKDVYSYHKKHQPTKTGSAIATMVLSCVVYGILRSFHKDSSYFNAIFSIVVSHIDYFAVANHFGRKFFNSFFVRWYPDEDTTMLKKIQAEQVLHRVDTQTSISLEREQIQLLRELRDIEAEKLEILRELRGVPNDIREIKEQLRADSQTHPRADDDQEAEGLPRANDENEEEGPNVSMNVQEVALLCINEEH